MGKTCATCVSEDSRLCCNTNTKDEKNPELSVISEVVSMNP